jgi:general secretion pathway protein C
VLLENLQTGRLELLTFAAAPVRPAPAAAPAAPAAATRPAPVAAIDLPKATVEKYLANLPDLLASALATPRYRDVDGRRVVDGFELSQVRVGGVAAELGLRDGDVLTEVNGEALDGMPAVMRLFAQASSMSRATVVVLRGGQRLTFVLNVKREGK